MKIKITGHHLEVTEALKQFVEEKMERVKRHFDQPIEVAVTLSVEKLDQKVGIHLHAMGHDFHISKSGADLYGVLDQAILVLDQQVLRQKSKLKEGRRQSKGKGTIEELTV